MQFEIKGTPFPVLTCDVSSGESMVCQKGAMCWMSPNMEMSTNAGGGIGKMFSRAISGESIFQNIYTAKGGDGHIAFASSFLGTILPMQVSAGNSIVAQKKAFLASESNVSFEIFFQEKIGAGFFGGEGFIMQKFSGNGYVFLEIDGSVVEYTLKKDEVMLIDTGYLAAMETTVGISIEKVKGLKNMVFGGEGLFNTKVTGPGKIWLQTMPLSQMCSTIAPYVVTNK